MTRDRNPCSFAEGLPVAWLALGAVICFPSPSGDRRPRMGEENLITLMVLACLARGGVEETDSGSSKGTGRSVSFSTVS